MLKNFGYKAKQTVAGLAIGAMVLSSAGMFSSTNVWAATQTSSTSLETTKTVASVVKKDTLYFTGDADGTFTINGVTRKLSVKPEPGYLPIRETAEALGGKVTWNKEKGLAVIEIYGEKIEVPTNSKVTKIVSGRTMMKIYDLAALLGLDPIISMVDGKQVVSATIKTKSFAPTKVADVKGFAKNDSIVYSKDGKTVTFIASENLVLSKNYGVNGDITPELNFAKLASDTLIKKGQKVVLTIESKKAEEEKLAAVLAKANVPPALAVASTRTVYTDRYVPYTVPATTYSIQQIPAVVVLESGNEAGAGKNKATITAFTSPKQQFTVYGDNTIATIPTGLVDGSFETVAQDFGKFTSVLAAENKKAIAFGTIISEIKGEILLTGATLSSNSFSGNIGESEIITISDKTSAEPMAPTETIVATSNNVAVATVTQNGDTFTITTVAPGTTTVDFKGAVSGKVLGSVTVTTVKATFTGLDSLVSENDLFFANYAEVAKYWDVKIAEFKAINEQAKAMALAGVASPAQVAEMTLKLNNAKAGLITVITKNQAEKVWLDSEIIHTAGNVDDANYTIATWTPFETAFAAMNEKMSNQVELAKLNNAQLLTLSMNLIEAKTNLVKTSVPANWENINAVIAGHAGYLANSVADEHQTKLVEIYNAITTLKTDANATQAAVNELQVQYMAAVSKLTLKGDAELLAAAKAAVESAELEIPLAEQGLQSVNTAWVQKQVTTIIGDKIASLVTYDAGTTTYNVLLIKGTLNVSTVVRVTLAVNPDIAAVADDKDLIDAVGTFEIPLANQTDEITRVACVQGLVSALIENGSTATVTFANDVYTVTLVKGAVTDTLVIIVTLEEVDPDIAAVADDKDLIDAVGTFEIPLANQTDEITRVACVQGLVSALIENGSTATVTFANDVYTVTLVKGAVTDTLVIIVTLEEVDPDIAAVADDKDLIDAVGTFEIPLANQTDEITRVACVQGLVSALIENGSTATVTFANDVYTVTLVKGAVTDTLVIIVTLEEVDPDIAAVADDKDLIDAVGTFEIPLANQTDEITRVACVQGLVSALIENGSTATVTFANDVYTVTLVKGAVTDTLVIIVTLEEVDFSELNAYIAAMELNIASYNNLCTVDSVLALTNAISFAKADMIADPCVMTQADVNNHLDAIELAAKNLVLEDISMTAPDKDSISNLIVSARSFVGADMSLAANTFNDVLDTAADDILIELLDQGQLDAIHTSIVNAWIAYVTAV